MSYDVFTLTNSVPSMDWDAILSDFVAVLVALKLFLVVVLVSPHFETLRYIRNSSSFHTLRDFSVIAHSLGKLLFVRGHPTTLSSLHEWPLSLLSYLIQKFAEVSVITR